MGKQGVKIEIMDTTLRDGEQTSGVSFVPHEKLMIARLLLEDLKVDRVEVASARVSEGEFEAVKMICDWAARRNLLQNWCYQFIGFFLATRHDGRPFQSALFAAGNTGTDKVKTFGREFTVTTDGVLEEGVAAINDDVAFIEVRLQGINGAVGASPGLHHQQDTTWCLEGFNKLLYCVVRDQFLACVFGNNFFGLFTGAVENGDGITTAFDVERQVAPHHCHTDNADLLLGHYLLLSGVVTATRSQLKCDDNVSPKYKELIVKIC